MKRYYISLLLSLALLLLMVSIPKAIFAEGLSLEEYVRLALSRHQPAQVALEEIGYAGLKLREGARQLYPSVSLTRYDATGEYLEQDYEEREVRIEFAQPVYRGGSLRAAVRQADINREIAQKNYERIKAELVLKVETAYYKLVAAQMNLELQEKLQDEGKKILRLVEDLYRKGLTTPLEISDVRSKYERILLQVAIAEQDLSLARLTFQQALNADIPVEIGPRKLEFKPIELDLDECLRKAAKYRPDYFLNKFWVQFNEYEKKIAEGESRFAVDLTGYYGAYEGAFETDPMSDAENWYVGVKVTKPLGGSTLTSSVSSEETQPRFAQYSGMSVIARTVEFKLLDNLKRLSERKRADIGLLSSMSDLNEMRKKIIFEVKGAFLDYQKAITQIDTALEEIRFCQREVEILRARARVGEELYSEVLEGEMKLTNVSFLHIGALADYYLALAKLSNATGYGIELSI